MKSKFIYLLSILFVFALSGCSNDKKENNTSEDNSVSINRVNANVNNTVVEEENTTNNIENEIIQEPIIESREEELATFSTKLGGSNTPRSRNIGITTKKLNETVVENGASFSFCETVGKPTSDKGYEEADSFDADGNTVKTLGGGNCQVSSTLYNVLLQIDGIKVTERHEHSKEVHYVKKGKDAAVSYGSVDLKFKNNTGNKIKIYSDSDLKSVNIKIVKILG